MKYLPSLHQFLIKVKLKSNFHENEKINSTHSTHIHVKAINTLKSAKIKTTSLLTFDS